MRARRSLRAGRFTLAAVVLSGVLLVVAAPAAATVKRVTFTAAVPAGDYASLTVRVAPRARCSIRVEYKTGLSRAKGLGGSNTTPGHWPVTVDCGKSGKLALRLRVVGS